MGKQDDKLLGRYTLGEVLGVGGMGTVVEAHDDVLGRRVAIKFLKEEYANDEAGVERFRREARIAASLSHPGIAQVFDFQEDDGRKFIVMELLQGRDLHTQLAENGSMGAEDAARVIAEVATALGHAHEEGAVHRDIKPGNIFITTTGAVKVTDFGIAVAKSQTAVTATGELLGTAMYLSPEQINGSKATPSSDVYALGCVLFQVLTGRPPYEGESQMAIAQSHTKDPVPSARQLEPSIPEEMDAVVQTAMAKDPHERYPTGAEMAADLRAILGNLDTAPAGVAGVPTEVISAPRTEIQPQSSMSTPGLRDRRRFRAPRQVIAVLLLAIALVTVALTARTCSTPLGPAKLSTLTGKHIDEAKAAAKSLGIGEGNIDVKDAGFTEEDAGIVVAQDPPPGTEVTEGFRLVLSVSKGKGVRVPNVLDMDQQEAEELLRQAGFAVDVLTEPASDDKKGKVIGFEPNGLQPPGSTITLTIGEEADDEKRRGRGKDADE